MSTGYWIMAIVIIVLAVMPPAVETCLRGRMPNMSDAARTVGMGEQEPFKPMRLVGGSRRNVQPDPYGR